MTFLIFFELGGSINDSSLENLILTFRMVQNSSFFLAPSSFMVEKERMASFLSTSQEVSCTCNEWKMILIGFLGNDKIEFNFSMNHYFLSDFIVHCPVNEEMNHSLNGFQRFL